MFLQACGPAAEPGPNQKTDKKDSTLKVMYIYRFMSILTSCVSYIYMYINININININK